MTDTWVEMSEERWALLKAHLQVDDEQEAWLRENYDAPLKHLMHDSICFPDESGEIFPEKSNV